MQSPALSIEVESVLASNMTTDNADHPPPYSTRPTRWIRPIVLALLLAALDEQGVIAFLVGVFLVLGYIPATFMRKKYVGYRKERMIRFGIYLSAVATALALVVFNRSLAEQRAHEVIVAVESYKASRGTYPDKLDQLVPEFIAEIPAKARSTLADSGFRYIAGQDSHLLMYVAFPPFGRPVYTFESKRWGYLD